MQRFASTLASLTLSLLLVRTFVPTRAVAADRPCKDDIAKFCKDMRPGGGAIVRCLRAHEAELSPACKAQGERLKEAFKNFRAACKDDAAKLCKDAKAGAGAGKGNGGIVKCLKSRESELSAGCKAALHPGPQ